MTEKATLMTNHDADQFDAALRLTERAARALLTGRPHTAAQHYDLAALLATTEDGARVLRMMACEIRFGLLTGDVRH